MRSTPRRLRMHVDALGRLERADQDRRRLAFGLADEVEQLVDAVREVHVHVRGRTEQDAAARRRPAERVAGRIVDVVALGLDDHAGGRPVRDGAADQVARDVVHGACEEGGGESRSHRGHGRDSKSRCGRFSPHSV